ncbi:hypothetical protein P20480_2624 [Pseudoalteromonas sp. BSi20480]|nr:hypothetical protein P20480_2624 [Pseudoalteromonas sp. BSi20480]
MVFLVGPLFKQHLPFNFSKALVKTLYINPEYLLLVPSL